MFSKNSQKSLKPLLCVLLLAFQGYALADYRLQVATPGVKGAGGPVSGGTAQACTTPWGTSLASGSAILAYTTSSVTTPATCASVQLSLSCANGVLSDARTTLVASCAETNPADAAVVLLMHMDGPTVSDMVVDTKGHSITPSAGAALTTSSKFGSGAFNQASNEYLGLPVAADLTFSGDFTIEFWAKANSGTTTTKVAIGSDYSVTNNQIQLNHSAVGRIGIYAGNGWMSYAFGVDVAQWHHYAFSRSGNTMYLAVDGNVQSVPWTSGKGNFNLSGGAIGVLRNYGASQLNGQIDEVRFTNGYARYTTSFTPPAAPF